MKNACVKNAPAALLLCLTLLFCGCAPVIYGKTDTSAPSEEGGTRDNTEAQEKTDGESVPVNDMREDYDLGTCKDLSGNVSVILFYIDDFESAWTDEEISRFTEYEVEPGLLFLEQEAKKYGIELDLTVKKSYSSIFYDDEVITSIANTGLASADVLWHAAVQSGYSSSTKMIEALRKKYKTEEIVCITVFNKGGTSYALNPKRGTDTKIDEHCIVFARELNTANNGPEGSQAAVVAHEMLHLYGAEDLYASTSRKSLARRYFPNDIMLSAAYDIGTNTVDAATAFYIGWTDTVPEVFWQNGW